MRLIFSRSLQVGLILLFLSGCILLPGKKSSIVFDTTCQPPCWESIIPGKTTKSEALGILSIMEGVDLKTIKEYDQPYLNYDAHLIWGFKSDEMGSLFFTDDRVELIRLSMIKTITLDEAVHTWGEPKFIVVTPLSGDYINYLVDYLYPEDGVWLTVGNNLPKSGHISIQEDSKIDEVSFFDPAQYDQMQVSWLSNYAKAHSEKIDDLLHPWEGFGTELKVP